MNGTEIISRLVWLAAIAAGMVPHASAADGNRLPTIGLAIPVDAATDAPFQAALRQGLTDLGYVDGKSIRFEVRYSDGNPQKLRQQIRELVDLKVDVLMGDAPVLKQATSTIPIVSPTMGDPVRTGLASSLAHPGGNVTGLSYQRYETDPKLIQLTRELLPKLKRLCVIFNVDRERDLARYVDGEFRRLANSIGVDICSIPVRTREELAAAGRQLKRERPDAALLWASAFTFQHRKALLRLAGSRLPLVAEGRAFAKEGAILSYTVDWPDMFRRSAGHIDKILRGANPGDLPIEQPTKFELVVNLKAAKAAGINVPEAILLRADEVIK